MLRRFGPSLKDPAAAQPVAYDEHFDRLLREAERGSTAAGRRAAASPKVFYVLRATSVPKMLRSLFLCILRSLSAVTRSSLFRGHSLSAFRFALQRTVPATLERKGRAV